MESENHGWAKRRTWRKLPIGVDEASGEIVAAAVTAFDVSDGQLLPGLLDQIGENIAQVSGDRASDVRECYVGRAARKQKMVITATASLLHGNVPIKTIFGDRVRSRCFQAQATDILIRCAALNRMTHLGIPYSYPCGARTAFRESLPYPDLCNKADAWVNLRVLCDDLHHYSNCSFVNDAPNCGRNLSVSRQVM
jgi:hypothetical protein